MGFSGMPKKKVQSKAPAGDVTMTAKREIFRRLVELPANHEFWKNQQMFTRPVFTQESRQMADSAAFWRWADGQPAALQRLINETPNVEPRGEPAEPSKEKPKADRYAEAVKLPDGSLENFMPRVGGESFRCSCGCNVFHKPNRKHPELYQCNACDALYEGA